MAIKNKKTIIGRTEKVDFPDLGLEGIEAKIDTGAYSTAIHSHKIWVEEIDKKKTLNFELFDPVHKYYRKTTIRTANFHQKSVRSSNGKVEQRYIIKTAMVLGGKKRITDLSLTNRRQMRYPVLVGRKFLKRGFLVDVSKTYISQLRINDKE